MRSGSTRSRQSTRPHRSQEARLCSQPCKPSRTLAGGDVAIGRPVPCPDRIDRLTPHGFPNPPASARSSINSRSPLNLRAQRRVSWTPRLRSSSPGLPDRENPVVDFDGFVHERSTPPCETPRPHYPVVTAVSRQRGDRCKCLGAVRANKGAEVRGGCSVGGRLAELGWVDREGVGGGNEEVGGGNRVWGRERQRGRAGHGGPPRRK